MRTCRAIFMLPLFLAACDSDDPPAAPKTMTFTGSARCAECHQAAYRDWQGSHHQLAMQRPTAATVLGDFDNRSFDYFGRETRFLSRGKRFVVETSNADGEQQAFDVVYTFGVEPLQQYLVAQAGGRLQALPFAWDSRPAADGGERWFHLYADEYVGPGDTLHWTGRNHNWNYMCAECHSTDIRMNYDAANDSFDTRFAEVSVGCEACHGPGSRHIEQARAGQFDASHGLAVNLDDRGEAAWLVDAASGMAARSEPAAALQQPEACGRCHARRSVIATEYEYGRPLTDTHMPSLLEESLYYADGQIRDEVYVYGSFLQSRMYAAGVTCTDCHNPHSAQLHAGPDPDASCAQCHAPERFADPAHSGHRAADAGCADCHMPATTYMSVDPRRDHSFRVPRPDLAAETGAPDTCSDCHSNRDDVWAMAAYRELFGEKRLATPHYGPAIAAGRRGPANTPLLTLVAKESAPAIARATALTLLTPPLDRDGRARLSAALGDNDPLLRIAALRSLPLLTPEAQVARGLPLLNDPVRGVRLEAAVALAPFQELFSHDDRRRFRSAADEYRGALKASANRPESLLALGSFAAMTGRRSDALDYFRRAVDIAPALSVAHINLADALRGAGDEAAAGEQLATGLEQDPDNAALLHAWGLHRVRAGRADEGLPALRRAFELDSGNRLYAYVLGVALNSLGRPEAAIEHLRQARAAHPGDYDIGWALATILRDHGDTAAARSVASALAEQFPGDRKLQVLLESLQPGERR